MSYLSDCSLGSSPYDFYQMRNRRGEDSHLLPLFYLLFCAGDKYKQIKLRFTARQ